MASGPLLGGGGGGDGSSREKQRWTDSNKVYTRKSFNKSSVTGGGGGVSNKSLLLEHPQTLASEEPNLSSQQQISARSDDSSSLKVVSGMAPNRDPPPPGNGSVRSGFARAENRVTINLGTKPKQEIRELRRRLTSELEQVRSMVKKLEAKELQLVVGGYSHSQLSMNDAVDNGRLLRVNSDVASVGLQDSRPLHQLSVSVVENSQGGLSDVVEKEKRTPKVNKYYRNSDFISGKEKFPPPESNKKSKSHSKKHGGGGGGGGNYGFGMDKSNPVFMECSSLLEKLMKHKHGWVFNKPVDVKLLGLHDYYTIIKHPMDLGTVKTRLNKNWYKSPKEFAEDVRLTFRNAMTYNPKGQDVHVMAELLLKMFEDGWAVIEAEYNLNPRFEENYDIGAPTPTSKRTPAPPPFSEMRKTLDRSESTTLPSEFRPKPTGSGAPSGRTPAPKKPKAKEPNKRDMTYEEKQRLSMNLQSLPPEKLDNIVQIIRRRNSSLCQRDDEIEVDIDVVDPETLWELDRFVTNYKKSLSKNKRKAELAMQAREPEQSAQDRNPKPAVVEAPKETKSDEKNAVPSSPVQGEKQGDNASRSCSSSSSSSDSGSSSSDSDSDSSSASDAGPA